MPLEPVTDYDQPRYPTLEGMAHRRRDFFRRVGLAAIAAAFGPHAGCSAGGGTQSGGPVPVTTPPTPPPHPQTPEPRHSGMLAGVPPPPRWPGARGAIVGGGPIEIQYADGVTGWVAVAAVFDPSNQRLESALLDAEAWIAAIVRKRLASQRSGFLTDAKRSSAAETEILDAIRAAVGVKGLDSVALSEVDAEAARAVRREAPPPAPRTESVARPGAPAAVPAPPTMPAPVMEAPAMPATAAPAPYASAEPVRRLPRAGAKCPLHPSGCRRSEASGA